MPEGAGIHSWPRLVFWETTAACNLDCSHCRRTETEAGASVSELSTEEAERLVDELACMGRPLLVLSGGEPLLRRDIFRLAERATGRGLMVALASNGTLIDAVAALDIRDCGIRRVSVSLDGPDASVHDAFRRQRGSFASALRGIAALREVGMPVQMNVTVTRHNVDRLNDMVNLAKGVGAVALHFFLLVPVGCGLEIAEDQAISAESYEETLEWLYQTERREPDLQLKATCAPHYFRVVRQQAVVGAVTGESGQAHPPSLHRQTAVTGPLRAATRGCLAGTGVCFVSHTGKVYGCGYLPVEAGDIRRDGLSAVWLESPLFAELRDLDALKGACGICGYKRVCGGCRARAYGAAGDYLGEEPLCSYLPPGAHRRSQG